MSVSERELHEQIGRAYQLPRGPGRFAALDAVFRQADAAGLTAFAFNARMSAIDEFHNGGDPTRAFMAFSWCLATYDRRPDLVQGWHTHALLWRFKWMVWALTQFPEIPLDRTQSVLDDMQRRYRLGGHSMHAVYQHRWMLAYHTGDRAAAEDWYDQMLAAPRDGLSDCHACVPTSQVYHLAWLGRLEDAVEIGAPFTRGGCSEQPHTILSALMLPYLRTGRLDEAVEAHREAYRRMRQDRHHFDDIAQHVLFCGLTGNEARGLELIEHHLSWLERPSSPYADMAFSSAAAVVLRRLVETGRAELVVSRLSEDGTRRSESTVAELGAELAARSRALAARFDQRNGNTHQSEHNERRLAADPLIDSLALPVTAGRGGASGEPRVQAALESLARRRADGDRTGVAQALLELAFVLRNAGRKGDATEVAEEALPALAAAGLADDAYRCRFLLVELYGPGGQRDRSLDLIEAMLAAPQLSSQEPGEARLLAMAARLGGPQAPRRWRRLIALHRAGGDFEAALAEADSALRQLDLPDAADLLPLTDEIRAESPPLDRGRVAYVDLTATRVVARLGRLEEALRRVELILAAEGADSDEAAWWRDEASRLRVSILLRVGDHVEAEAQARELLLRRADDRWPAAVLLAKILQAQGRHDELAAVRTEHSIDEGDLDGDDLDEYSY